MHVLDGTSRTGYALMDSEAIRSSRAKLNAKLTFVFFNHHHVAKGAEKYIESG